MGANIGIFVEIYKKNNKKVLKTCREREKVLSCDAAYNVKVVVNM